MKNRIIFVLLLSTQLITGCVPLLVLPAVVTFEDCGNGPKPSVRDLKKNAAC